MESAIFLDAGLTPASTRPFSLGPADMASRIESTRAVACVLCLSRIMYAPARRMSHRRTSPSAPPVANAYSFDRDHSIACTLPLCPDSVCAITFDAGSHNRTTSSSEPIATSECDVARALSAAARHLVASSVSVATLKQFASQHFTAPSYDPVKNTPVSDGNHRAHDVAYACPISSLVVASRGRHKASLAVFASRASARGTRPSAHDLAHERRARARRFGRTVASFVTASTLRVVHARAAVDATDQEISALNRLEVDARGRDVALDARGELERATGEPTLESDAERVGGARPGVARAGEGVHGSADDGRRLVGLGTGRDGTGRDGTRSRSVMREM